jgi:hypothetical protein
VNSLAKVADQCREVLTTQEITAQGPGTILADIQTMIEFIGPGGLATSSSTGNLPAVVLPELNQRLSHPVELDLTRKLLRDYPNIAGLYVLLRVMDFIHADTKRVAVNEEALSLWSGLNPAERYFALLEAWLIHGDDAVLGGSPRPVYDQFENNRYFLAKLLSSNWKTFPEYIHNWQRPGAISSWNTQLQARFGLIEIKARPQKGRQESTRGWIMLKAKRTDWGRAVAWAITEYMEQQQEEDGDDDYDYYQLPEEAGFGFFQPAFQPYFPEWQKLFRDAPRGRRPGCYIFKASLEPKYYDGPIWRRLAVPDQISLDDLAYAILRAFDFYDFDHLYRFQFRDQLGKARNYYHPYADGGPYASEIDIGEANLPEQSTMKFRFDFGDCWDFLVQLERIDPPDAKLQEPKVLETAGEAPKQYPMGE